VSKSYAKTGAVAGLRWTGGLVGFNQGSISASYAANNVTGTQYVGGLAGESFDAISFGIKDSFAKGAVTGTDTVGGLVGKNDSGSNVTTSYASGTVAGGLPLGGLIGDNQNANNASSYWNKDTGGAVGVGGIGSASGVTGLTSAQMLLQASFTGFNFTAPWRITEGVTQPFLDWMATAPTIVSAASRKNHTGVGDFDLPLALTPANPTTEPRQGPVATVVFTFDKAITGATVTVSEGTATAGAPTFSGAEVRVGLTAVANEQYVTVGLTNVVAADGGTGGSASVRLGILVGDVNGNRNVTLGDMILVNAELTQPVTATNYLRDLNMSGTITIGDKLLLNGNLTKFLPTP
jgi:hypothetical protein